MFKNMKGAKMQTMIEIQGGGATRKTGSCCGLQKRHSGPDPESINVDNRLRLGGRSDESRQITQSSSRHSELDSESINANKNRLHFDSKSDEKSRKAAFTMAEVLITLGIIGIVAAMTLPSLIGKYQEKQWKVAYKKAYSGMSQAFLRMQANDEVSDMTPTYTEDGLAITPSIGENFKTMSKYFNTVKTCFDRNASECWECADGQAGYIYNGGPDWLGCGNMSYAFIDYSGVAWYLYSNNEWPVLVDVNGFNRPNQLGKDRFVMRFASNNSDLKYVENPDIIQPWDDVITKSRWCPSGNCLYRTWLLE